jgi:hypothetical protein
MLKGFKTYDGNYPNLSANPPDNDNDDTDDDD